MTKPLDESSQKAAKATNPISNQRIKRVAEALCDADHKPGYWRHVCTYLYPDENAEVVAEYTAAAQAALEADDSHLAKENERLRYVLGTLVGTDGCFGCVKNTAAGTSLLFRGAGLDLESVNPHAQGPILDRR